MTNKEQVKEARREFEKACDEHVKRRNAKVYISGPMTDKATGEVTIENRIAFMRAQCLIKKEGYLSVVNPSKVWMCRYPRLYRLLERIVGKEWAYRLTLLYDLWLMMRCDLIYKIPGWKESRGANIESCIAYHFGIWPLPTKHRERIDRKLAKTMAKWKDKNLKSETI